MHPLQETSQTVQLLLGFNAKYPNGQELTQVPLLLKNVGRQILIGIMQSHVCDTEFIVKLVGLVVLQYP